MEEAPAFHLEDFMVGQIAALAGDFQQEQSYSSSFPPPATTFSANDAFGCREAASRPSKMAKTDHGWDYPCLDASPQKHQAAQMLSFYSKPYLHQETNTTFGGGGGFVRGKGEVQEALSMNSEVLTSRASFSDGQHQTCRSSSSANHGTKRDYVPTAAAAVGSTGGRTGGGRPPAQMQDHIIAERKRREKLSQRFIALSAVVPGLKKMDKASVLGDAIKYVKQLQEQVKALEDKSRKKTVESVVLVKRSVLTSDDDASSSDENFDGTNRGDADVTLPEIEARATDRNVLIRVHCEKKKGVLVKALAEIERLDLTVLNSSLVSFADTAVDLTIVAQMEEEFRMPVKDLVKALRTALAEFA
ncbi:Transcription factor [Nymphaea thermarum]|nr:Transcription factor [Nymphaea thermarum]